MARRSEYLNWLCEQLAPLGTLRVRAMFGAFGLYCDELFFAIVHDDILYLKVDDLSRAEFAAENLRPFTYPMKDGSTSTLSYYPVPDYVLESGADLQNWARKGIAAALRAQKTPKNTGKGR